MSVVNCLGGYFDGVIAVLRQLCYIIITHNVLHIIISVPWWWSRAVVCCEVVVLWEVTWWERGEEVSRSMSWHLHQTSGEGRSMTITVRRQILATVKATEFQKSVTKLTFPWRENWSHPERATAVASLASPGARETRDQHQRPQHPGQRGQCQCLQQRPGGDQGRGEKWVLCVSAPKLARSI